METVRDCNSTANRCHCYTSDRVNKTLKDAIARAAPTHAAKDLSGFLLQTSILFYTLATEAYLRSREKIETLALHGRSERKKDETRRAVLKDLFGIL